MSFILPDDKSATISFQALDVRGVPARIDERPEFAVSDPAILSLMPSEDGLSATVMAAEPVILGVAQVRVAVDADLGDGVRRITGLLEVEVVGGEAVSLNVTATLDD